MVCSLFCSNNCYFLRSKHVDGITFNDDCAASDNDDTISLRYGGFYHHSPFFYLQGYSRPEARKIPHSNGDEGHNTSEKAPSHPQEAEVHAISVGKKAM